MTRSLGHMPPHDSSSSHMFIIDDRSFTSGDPVLTGRQLLMRAGKTPVEEHLVYWLGTDGILEEIGLDEPIDLRRPGTEKFLTFRSDRSFRFELDGKRQDWGASKIGEANLVRLAGGGKRLRIWQERKDTPDRLLKRGELVDLTPDGVERFYTRIELVVTVVNEDNGTEFELEGRPEERLESFFARMYAKLGVARQSDDRLRCESGGADVFASASLTLEEYVRAGHCKCLVWLFAGGTGGAVCR